jgi:hypothetical protein
VLHPGAVERTEQRTALHPRETPFRVHPNAIHRSQVDHQAVLGDAESEHAVAAATDTDLEATLAAIPDGLRHLVRIRAPNDLLGPPIDHGVPHPPSLVIAGAPLFQHTAVGRTIKRHGRGLSGQSSRNTSRMHVKTGSAAATLEPRA